MIDNSELNDVFTEDTIRATYTLRSLRNSLALTYSLQNQDYEDDFVLRDEDETSFRAVAERRLTPRITAGASIEFVERNFLNQDVQDDFVLGNATFAGRWVEKPWCAPASAGRNATARASISASNSSWAESAFSTTSSTAETADRLTLWR